MTLLVSLNLNTSFTPGQVLQILTINAFLILGEFYLALIPALLFAINIVLFRRAGRDWNRRVLPPISVLIPVRDEEASIEATLDSLLKSRGVDMEVVVLDDGSSDRTAEIVQTFVEKDSRVRFETAPPLPDGWNGKQHACWTLASLATRDVFCFLDADVSLGTEALYRMVSELNYEEKKKPQMALVSGFPRQITGTFLERLLLPLIHFVLLGYLPLIGERLTSWSMFAAGCGQVLMVRREPYFACGGHSAIPMTMHDGVKLPKLFRKHGFRTRVFDLSQDAVCRMYHSFGEVWQGLSKNATEGMASWLRLPIFTLFLFVGQILPIPIALVAFLFRNSFELSFAVFVLSLGYGMRFFSAWRYGESWFGALLHPLGVLVLLVLEWCALLRKLVGGRVEWKQREYRMG